MKIELQAKPYGIKLRCYCECLREKLRNLMGTCWEHIGNKEKKTRKKELPPPHPQKGKKTVHQGCMVSHPIGCMIFFIPKLSVTIKKEQKEP
jgi:hypothetical protein